MQKKIFLILTIWCLCVMTSCSLMRSQPYKLPNPILAAFHHQMDLQPLRDTIAKDLDFQIEEVDGGFVLYGGGKGMGPAYFRFWINDSLLVYRLEAMPYMARPPNTCLVGRVILEASFRENYSDLATNINQGFSHWSVDTYRNDAHHIYQTQNGDRVVPFNIDQTLIQPVETLSWLSSAFGNQDAYQFRNGILHGPFQSSKKLGLVHSGFFRNGIETGTWTYKDSLGQLQYIEEYDKNGTLIKVIHQPGNTYYGAAPLPSLQKLKYIHLIMLVVLILGIGYIFYLYFKALRNFKEPYKGQTSLEIFGSIIVSPFLGFCGGVALMMVAHFFASVLGPIINWDLPVDVLEIFPVLFFFVIFESFYFIITNRFLDLIWHVVIMVFGILLYYEWETLVWLERYL